MRDGEDEMRVKPVMPGSSRASLSMFGTSLSFRYLSSNIFVSMFGIIISFRMPRIKHLFRKKKEQEPEW